MKKQFLKSCVLLSATFLLTGMFTSCVYDKDAEEPVPTGDGSLVININSTPVGSVTRSTDISSTTTVQADEKKIQSMAVAIFREGTMVYYNYLKSLDKSAAGTGFNTTVDNIAATPNQFADGDAVVIVANVPEAVFSSLKTPGTTTLTAFKAATVSIDQALDAEATPNNAVESNNLPMYGSATVTTTDGKLKANVTVRHMVSKVTLEQLTVDGLATNCSFKPEQVFLFSVADALKFTFTDETDMTTYQAPTVSSWYNTGDDGQTNFKQYLSTKTYSDTELEELDNTNTTWSKSVVLYTMPNTAYGTDAANTDTRLVIKGTWTDADNTSNSGTCYYTFRLLNVVAGQAQAALDQRKIYPNRNYRLRVILKRKGATTVEGGVDVNANTAVTIQNVTDWTTGEQTTEFGSDGSANTTTE